MSCERVPCLRGCRVLPPAGCAPRAPSAAGGTGALAGGGLTVAVCGHGLKHLYPHDNRALAARIREHGALLSELPPDTAVRPGLFRRRNRLISGLALGTVVVEASLASGSLITAR